MRASHVEIADRRVRPARHRERHRRHGDQFLIDEVGKVQRAWPTISPKDTPTNLLAALARD